jgi:serine/threonine protein kinase
MPMFERGALLGKYEIIQLIGQGGMGVVYLAEDKGLGRRVALKVLDTVVTATDQFEDRFRQEARVVAQFEHPNIIQVYALDQIDGQWVIAMPYVEGGSLAEAIGSVWFKRSQALRCTLDILSALVCCHNTGIVHRDIKPSNILLSERGAQLSDFGLARVLAEHHLSVVRSGASSGLFLGTPRYAPPEAWEGERPCTPWDVYSTGMVLFESLAGRPAYDAETPLAIVKQRIDRPVPQLRDHIGDVSDKLNNAVCRMLAADSADRPQNAQEALDELLQTPEVAQELGSGGSTMIRVAPPAGARRRSTESNPALRWLKNHWRSLAAVIVIVCALLTGIAAAILAGGKSPIDTESGISNQRSDALEHVYDTIEPAAQAPRPAHIMIAREPGTRTWTLLASHNTELWSGEAVPHKNSGFAVQGHWASYSDASALFFSHGTFEGAMMPSPGMNVASLTLHFRNEIDGSVWPRTFILQENEAAWSRGKFLQRVENADFVQPMLYNELIPRNTDWASNLEAFLAGSSTERVMVPWIRGYDPVKIDGQLTEAIWDAGYEDGAGRVNAEGQEDVTLIRYTAEGVYLGVRSNSGHTAIAFSVVNHFNVPLMRSPQYIVTFENGSVVESQCRVAGKEQTWACPWRSAESSTDNADTFELFIPYEDFLHYTVPAEPNDRWRMNIQLLRPAGGKPVARWGDEVLQNATAGLVLIFAEQPDKEGGKP